MAQFQGRLEADQKLEKKINECYLANLPKIVESYYMAIRTEGKSLRTIEQYLQSIYRFYKFIDDPTEDFYKRVTVDDVHEFILSQSVKIKDGVEIPTGTSFRVLNWCGVDSLFKFLLKRGLIEESPVLREFHPKHKYTPKIDYLTPEEIDLMLREFENTQHEMLRVRNRVLFILAVCTGLRAAAIANMNIEDIDFAEHTIVAVEKGQRRVEVLMNDAVEHALREWLEYSKDSREDPTSGPVFFTERETRINPNGITFMLKRVGKIAIGREITAHVLRHTCATLLYEATGDIYLCSQQLNHMNVSTTQIYATLSEERKRHASNILGDAVDI